MKIYTIILNIQFLLIPSIILGQIPLNGYESDYISFIRSTKNPEDAWVAFQRLTEKNIQYKNWVYTKRKIEEYQQEFITRFPGYDTLRFTQLRHIIDHSYSNTEGYQINWLPSRINSNQDERNPMIFKDGNLTYLYFTRNEENKKYENENIYWSVQQKGKWTRPEEFAYNTKDPESITYASPNFIISQSPLIEIL